MLVAYEDHRLCDLLEYGFPLDYKGAAQPGITTYKNHKGARDHEPFLNEYFLRETALGRIMGPFDKNPLTSPLAISPLNTVPKAESNEQRVIVDLSFPPGASINEGISKTMYLGESINLTFPTIDRIAALVWENGRGCHIYKRDLAHAYRQFSIDPGDWKYLGYNFGNKFYIDTVLCMGQRNAAAACQRATSALAWVHRNRGFGLENYLDDMIGVERKDRSLLAYDELGVLLTKLGLEEKLLKACPPATEQMVLGIEINTERMTLRISDTRMGEKKGLLNEWGLKTMTTLKELQSLIGKLAFISKCVLSSRVFMNRLLCTLRAASNDTPIPLSV